MTPPQPQTEPVQCADGAAESTPQRQDLWLARTRATVVARWIVNRSIVDWLRLLVFIDTLEIHGQDEKGHTASDRRNTNNERNPFIEGREHRAVPGISASPTNNCRRHDAKCDACDDHESTHDHPTAVALPSVGHGLSLDDPQAR